MRSTIRPPMGTPAPVQGATPVEAGASLSELVTESRTDVRPGRLPVLVAACSLLLTVATALHVFAAFDHTILQRGLADSGLTDPATASAVFVGLRILGVLLMAANALGILALWARPDWLFAAVLATNVVQALVWVLVPGAVWTAAQDAYGWSHTLPGMVLVGLSVALAVTLAATLVRRGPWGAPTS